jgi:predicted nucleic acid-binding protein
VHGYLLDTNIVRYWFDERRSEHQRVVQHIQKLPDATPLMISAITLGEIEYGLQVARIDALTRDYRAFMSIHYQWCLILRKRPEFTKVRLEPAYSKSTHPMQDAIEGFGLNS